MNHLALKNAPLNLDAFGWNPEANFQCALLLKRKHHAAMHHATFGFVPLKAEPSRVLRLAAGNQYNSRDTSGPIEFHKQN